MWITASPASRPVIAGLVPAIHEAPQAITVARILDLRLIMDARVKPAHDELTSTSCRACRACGPKRRLMAAACPRPLAGEGRAIHVDHSITSLSAGHCRACPGHPCGSQHHQPLGRSWPGLTRQSMRHRRRSQSQEFLICASSWMRGSSPRMMSSQQFLQMFGIGPSGSGCLRADSSSLRTAGGKVPCVGWR